MPAATSNLAPTWNGYVSDTREALILFEATLQGHLHRVTRRPHDRERASLIRSGSVFIYEEGASGIKRWTDGVSWSPSRILNNFLIYRELEKPFPPGEKKRARPKPKSAGEEIKTEGGSDSSLKSPTTPSSATSPSFKNESSADRDAVRSLVGSLTDSYAFKEGGLVKKTMSVVVGGSHFHLVSYYNPEDVRQGQLAKPMDTELRYTKVRGELVTRQNFRAPIDDAEEVVPASQYGVPTPRPYALQHAPFMAPEYMQQAAMAQGFPPHSPYAMGMQQQSADAYDQRHGMQMHSPTQQSPTYMPQLPQMQMRANDFAQYQQPQYQDQRFSQQQQQQQRQQPPQSPDGYSNHMQMQGSAGMHWPSNSMGQR